MNRKRERLRPKNGVVSFLILFVTLVIAVGVTPPPLSGAYEHSTTDPPDWVRETTSLPGYTSVGIGADTATAVMDAVGKITTSLDPNIRRMEEQYKERKNTQLTRELADYQFGEVSVQTMQESYQDLVNDRKFNGLNQRIIRFRLDTGDTPCERKLYIEEAVGDVETYLSPVTNECEESSLIRKILEEGFSIRKHTERVVNHYVLIQYRPSESSSSTAEDTQSLSGDTDV